MNRFTISLIAVGFITLYCLILKGIFSVERKKKKRDEYVDKLMEEEKEDK